MKIEHTLDRIAAMKNKEKNKIEVEKRINEGKNEFKPFDVKNSGNSAAKVNISEKAMELGKIKNILKNDTTDNSQKIAKLKALIAENKYDVPVEKVADKMVDEYLKTDMS